MRFDFTPRRFFNPTPTSGGAPTPEDIANAEKLVNILQRIRNLTEGEARNRVEMFRAQGTLNEELKIYQEKLEQVAFQSDYIFNSFRDTTEELKGQNVLLSIGKSSFKKLSDIASDINFYQRGSNDLTDKQFKKMGESLKRRKDDLELVVKRYKAEGVGDKENEITRLKLKNIDEGLNAVEKKRLEFLEKEKSVYVASKNALEQALPILQNELDFSKKIFQTRKNLGGIAGAAADVISKYGGSLSQFLNIDAAKESVDEYNKKLIEGALKNDEVLDKLHKNELDRIRLEAELEGLEGDAREAKLTELNNLSKDDLRIKQEAIKSVDKLGNKFRSLGEFTKGLGEGLKKALTDPLVIITFFADKINEANKQVVELGKSFGVSYSVANQLREESVEYARSSSDNFVNTNRLLKAQSELSQQLGIAVKFSGQEAETFSRLTELVGLSADEAGKLVKFSAAAGVSTKNYEGSLLKGAFAAQQTTNSHFSAKEILQDVSKLSAGILVKFQGNPEALGKAVAQAKALGLTLEQVDKVGESLLNFESSIENELKAELITGRQLNLEKARYVALTGNQAELSREIAEQAGSLEDFQNMNVIQQKSLAEAFGMSKDEMADMLMKQEMINTFGDEASKLNKEQLADFQKQNKERGIGLAEYLQKQSEQQNAQEKFNNAITKLQDLVGNLVAGPFGQLLDILSDIAGIITTVISPVFTGISYVVGLIVDGFKTLAPVLVGVGALLSLIYARSIAVAVANVAMAAWSSFVGIPFLGPILATAATIAGVGLVTRLSKSTQSVQDGIAPSSEGPFTVTNRFGATAITATGDGVAVGPNINRSSPSPSLDLSPITNVITVLSSRMETLMNKQQTIPQFSLQVDGKAIGTAVGKQIETGTAQSQYTSYKVA